MSKFSIYYDDADDKNLKGHIIDAELLGQSIIATSTLLKKANCLINGSESKLSVKVTASKEGSFGVDFEIIDCIKYAVDILPIIGFSGIAGAAVLGAKNAFQVANEIKNKAIIEIDYNTRDHTASIKLNNKTVECVDSVAKLVSDPDVRQAMKEIVRQPLEGLESPVFKVINAEEEVVLQFDNEEPFDFTLLGRGSLVEKESETIHTDIHFTRVNFSGESGWRILYKNEDVATKLIDETFMQLVNESKEKFSKDDLFKVKLKITYTKSARTESRKFVIEQVLRHRVDEKRKLL